MPSALDPSYAFNYFRRQGWSPVQAAGIVGNLQWESGLITTRPGDGGSAIGYAQWHGPRQSLFQQLFHTPVAQGSPDQQLAFVQYELTHNYAGAGNALRGATSIEDATRIVMSRYEQPANSSSLGNRTSLASRIVGAAGNVAAGNDPQSRFIRDQENAMFPFLGDISSLLGGGAPLGSDAATGPFEAIGQAANNPMQFLQNWLASSNFFQRLALGVFAFILLAGFVYLLKSNDFDIGKTVTA